MLHEQETNGYNRTLGHADVAMPLEDALLGRTVVLVVHVAGAAEAAEQFTKLAREQALLMFVWHQLGPWLSPGQCIFPDLSGRTWSSWQEHAAAFSKAFRAIRRADEKEKTENLQFSCTGIV